MNKYKSGEYLLSETIPDNKIVKNSMTVDLKFQLSDCGSLPHLLMHLKDKQFLVPLVFQPVQPDQADLPIYKQVEEQLGSFDCFLIDIKSGDVTDAKL